MTVLKKLKNTGSDKLPSFNEILIGQMFFNCRLEALFSSSLLLPKGC